MSVAWYLTAVSAIGVIAVVGFRESAPARLTRDLAFA